MGANLPGFYFGEIRQNKNLVNLRLQNYAITHVKIVNSMDIPNKYLKLVKFTTRDKQGDIRLNGAVTMVTHTVKHV